MDDNMKSKTRATQPDDSERLREEGFKEGYLEGASEILKWLETEYLHAPNRPDRKSEEGEAILAVARNAGKHLRKLLKKKGIKL